MPSALGLVYHNLHSLTTIDFQVDPDTVQGQFDREGEREKKKADEPVIIFWQIVYDLFHTTTSYDTKVAATPAQHSGKVDILSPAAMQNAYHICHNVQVF